MKRVGGLSKAKRSDDFSFNAVNSVKNQLENKEGKSFKVYDCHSYKTQVVAGLNLFTKVHVGDENYYHLRIYKNLRNNFSLINYHKDKKKEDSIEYL